MQNTPPMYLFFLLAGFAKHKNLLIIEMFSLLITELPTKFSRDFQDKQTSLEYQ